jgi:hypothetical protein
MYSWGRKSGGPTIGLGASGPTSIWRPATSAEARTASKHSWPPRRSRRFPSLQTIALTSKLMRSAVTDSETSASREKQERLLEATRPQSRHLCDRRAIGSLGDTGRFTPNDPALALRRRVVPAGLLLTEAPVLQAVRALQRRGRDSNPRHALTTCNGFRDRSPAGTRAPRSDFELRRDPDSRRAPTPPRVRSRAGDVRSGPAST